MPRPQLCEPIARVLQKLGVRRAMVVSGRVSECDASLDEFSTIGENTIAEFYHDRAFATSVLDLENFPLQPATLADLAGGDRDINARIVREILSGRDRGARRDAVLLNSAAALFSGEILRSLMDGWEAAARLIDSGAAAVKLEQLAKPL